MVPTTTRSRPTVERHFERRHARIGVFEKALEQVNYRLQRNRMRRRPPGRSSGKTVRSPKAVVTTRMMRPSPRGIALCRIFFCCASSAHTGASLDQLPVPTGGDICRFSHEREEFLRNPLGGSGSLHHTQLHPEQAVRLGLQFLVERWFVRHPYGRPPDTHF